jgi:mRNA-degrading endonuclease YafQ of YafQ-DinJ toxin-antitoxin module
MLGVRSINITSDIRVHYEQVNNIVIFINIGSHSELY